MLQRKQQVFKTRNISHMQAQWTTFLFIKVFNLISILSFSKGRYIGHEIILILLLECYYLLHALPNNLMFKQSSGNALPGIPTCYIVHHTQPLLSSSITQMSSQISSLYSIPFPLGRNNKEADKLFTQLPVNVKQSRKEYKQWIPREFHVDSTQLSNPGLFWYFAHLLTAIKVKAKYALFLYCFK